MGNDWTAALIGAVLLAGYAAHILGARTHIPRVTLLLLVGLICGPSVLGIVPDAVVHWFALFAQLALAMVGFLIGEL